jgi:hypothetical protein
MAGQNVGSAESSARTAQIHKNTRIFSGVFVVNAPKKDWPWPKPVRKKTEDLPAEKATGKYRATQNQNWNLHSKLSENLNGVGLTPSSSCEATARRVIRQNTDRL